MNTSDGTDVISRPRYQDKFSELFAKINSEDLLEKHEKQLLESRKRKTSEPRDEETSAKIQATETDPDFEDWYNNTAHSEMHSEGEDLLELPPVTQPEEEKPVPTTTANIGIPTSANTNTTTEPTKKDNTNAAKQTSSTPKPIQTKETSKSHKSQAKGATTPKPAKNLAQKNTIQKNTGRRTPLNR